MLTVALYVVLVAGVAVLVFLVAAAVLGRSESTPELPPHYTATYLPEGPITGADVDAVKFTQTVRGYKTAEVDWTLTQLGGEIDRLRAELDRTRARLDAVSPAPMSGSPGEIDPEQGARYRANPE